MYTIIVNNFWKILFFPIKYFGSALSSNIGAFCSIFDGDNYVLMFLIDNSNSSMAVILFLLTKIIPYSVLNNNNNNFNSLP